jgi:hypothetical protein
MSDEPEVHRVQMGDLVTHFEKIRSEQGEEAYQRAVKNFALGMILKPRGDLFLKGAFPDLDLDAIRAEAEKSKVASPAQPPENPQQVMLNYMKQQVPNLKTQVQFDLFMQCFDALRKAMNAAYGLDKPSYEQFKGALDLLMGSGLKVSQAVEQLKENPEASSNEDFKQAPKQFQEQDVQTALLQELGALKSGDELNEWYTANKDRIHGQVVSPVLRNALLDSIRAKRNGFMS